MTASPPFTSGIRELSDLGPLLHKNGVTYRVWALGHATVVVEIEKPGMAKRQYALESIDHSGYFSVTDPIGSAGDLYQFSIDGGPLLPDFVSHYQPQGVLGPSMVVDHTAYEWRAKNWKRPSWNGHVIYECHVGTFTPEGTFRSTIEKLDHLRSLGITAVELMPVAEWSGKRGWGYDGVMLFAPHHAYGPPYDFQALIDACHLRGLAVILDVVFNHLGPEGNFSHQHSDYYFHRAGDTSWGQNFNLDGPNSKPVRTLLCQNIRYWLEEFRIDGFRMDATHAIQDTSSNHLLKEIGGVVHDQGGFILAEDERNLRTVLEPSRERGWNFDAVWADDFHHATRVNQTQEHQSYYSMFQGSADEIARTLQQGWLYTGQISPLHHKSRGTRCDDFSPERFIYCISNHDQVGNRLLGERLHQSITPAAYRALSLFLCFIPYTPLLFMGQEWGASTPFLYFTDMPNELGVKIAEGRKREFLETKFVTDTAELEKMSDPQSEETFCRSKLNWKEIEEEEHHGLLKLYQAGLKLRAELFGSKNPPRDKWQVEALEDTIILRYHIEDKNIAAYLYLKPLKKHLPEGSTILLRSNAVEFCKTAGDEEPETVLISI